MKPWIKYALWGMVALCILISLGVAVNSYLGYLHDKSLEQRGQLGDAWGGHLNVLLSFFTVVLLVATIAYERHKHREQMAVAERAERGQRYDALVKEFWEIQQSDLCRMPGVDTQEALEAWDFSTYETYLSEDMSSSFATLFEMERSWTLKVDDPDVPPSYRLVAGKHAYVSLAWDYSPAERDAYIKRGSTFFRLFIAVSLLVRIGQFIDHATEQIADEVSSERDWDRVRGIAWMIQRVCNRGYEDVLKMYMTGRALEFCHGLRDSGWLERFKTRIAIEQHNFPSLSWDAVKRQVVFDQTRAWDGTPLRPREQIVKMPPTPAEQAVNPPVIPG